MLLYMSEVLMNRCVTGIYCTLLPLDNDCGNGNGNSTGELGEMGIMCKIQNGGMGTGNEPMEMGGNAK